MENVKVAVLGAGSGGLAMAGDLALAGLDVNLYEAPEFKADFEKVIKSREIEVSGAGRTGVAKLNRATTVMEEALQGVDVINVVTLAQGHEIFYNRLAPHLADGQIVITHTAYYGSLQLKNILDTKGIDKDVRIGETATLLYGCRKIGPGKVRTTAVKSMVTFATLPASQTEETLEVVNRLFPQFVPAANVLQTSIDNLGTVFHTSIAALNIGRIEDTKGEFLFYIEGVTPSVARVTEALDNEKMAVERAFGGSPVLGGEQLKKAYGSKGRNLYEVFHSTKLFKDPVVGKAPSGLTPPARENRYVTEEVPYGLVPLAHLGDLAAVPTPTTKALVQIYSVCNQVDYMQEGLIIEKIGLAGKTVQEVIDYVS